MRALVVGGSGFIGSHLVDALLEAGAEVVVYDRARERYRETPAGVRWVDGELGDSGLLSSLLPDIDTLFHLASTTLPQTSNEDPAHDVQSNLVETVQMLEACVKQRVGKVVFLSSGGTVYGRVRELPVGEDHPTEPLCSYGIVKLAVERYLQLFHHLHGLRYAVMRPGNPYGERQSPDGIQGAVAVFLGRLARTESLEVWGDGTVVRDYFHVSDLARACVLAATSDRKRAIYNVGSGNGLSTMELLQRIEAIVGHAPPLDRKAARNFDVPELVLDASRIREELGWEPRVSLDEGLKRTWEWMRANA